MEIKLLQIQMPVELRERLREHAKLNRRTIGNEAIVIIQEELDRREGSADDAAS